MSVLWLLVGCTSGALQPKVQPVGVSQAPVGGVCNAQGAQSVIGKSATASVVEQARVGAGARMARVLHPGLSASMEFDAQRLTLEVDARGVIVAARCG